eukprot:Pgem_evm1s9809
MSTTSKSSIGGFNIDSAFQAGQKNQSGTLGLNVNVTKKHSIKGNKNGIQTVVQSKVFRKAMRGKN